MHYRVEGTGAGKGYESLSEPRYQSSNCEHSLQMEDSIPTQCPWPRQTWLPTKPKGGSPAKSSVSEGISPPVLQSTVHPHLDEKFGTPSDKLPNSSMGSTGRGEYAEDTLGGNASIGTLSSPSVRATKASYPEAEGPGREAAEVTLGFLKSKRVATQRSAIHKSCSSMARPNLLCLIF